MPIRGLLQNQYLEIDRDYIRLNLTIICDKNSDVGTSMVGTMVDIRNDNLTEYQYVTESNTKIEISPYAAKDISDMMNYIIPKEDIKEDLLKIADILDPPLIPIKNSIQLLKIKEV